MGDRFSAAEAKAWGLVNRVVPAGDVDKKTTTIALRLAKGPTNAIGRTKTLRQEAFNSTLEAQLRSEAASFRSCAHERNFAEEILAFVEKRNPEFDTT